MRRNGLTPKQQRFMQEYFIDCNATQAAIRAGYSPRTAYSIGQENLKKPDVRDAINKALDARADRCEISAERVLKELARVAFTDLRQVAKWTRKGLEAKPSDELEDDAAAALQEVSQHTTEAGAQVKVKLHSKIEALDKLAKHLNLYQDPETLRQTRSVTINIIEGKASPKVINGEDEEPPPPDPTPWRPQWSGAATQHRVLWPRS